MSNSKISSLAPNTLLIKIDTPYTSGVQCCSPNIKKFLQGLTSSNECLNFDFLERSGVFFDEGQVFRCSESLRSYAEQARLYEKSHEGSFRTSVSVEPRSLNGTRYIWDGSKVLLPGGVTNALPGSSFHNWGLAVDIYFRKFGWEAWSSGNSVVVNGKKYSMKEFYLASGLVDWAKKCGLDWGGDWVDFQDTVHFEDGSCKIPPQAYWLDKNCDYQAYCEVQKALGKSAPIEAVEEVEEVEPSKERKSSFLVWLGGLFLPGGRRDNPFYFALLGFFGFLIFRFLKKKLR